MGSHQPRNPVRVLTHFGSLGSYFVQEFPRRVVVVKLVTDETKLNARKMKNVLLNFGLLQETAILAHPCQHQLALSPGGGSKLVTN